ncbi:hypothetical protein Tco_0950588, partial [Tanacetum coccineum]
NDSSEVIDNGIEKEVSDGVSKEYDKVQEIDFKDLSKVDDDEIKKRNNRMGVSNLVPGGGIFDEFVHKDGKSKESAGLKNGLFDDVANHDVANANKIVKESCEIENDDNCLMSVVELYEVGSDTKGIRAGIVTRENDYELADKSLEWGDKIDINHVRRELFDLGNGLVEDVMVKNSKNGDSEFLVMEDDGFVSDINISKLLHKNNGSRVHRQKGFHLLEMYVDNQRYVEEWEDEDKDLNVFDYDCEVNDVFIEVFCAKEFFLNKKQEGDFDNIKWKFGDVDVMSQECNLGRLEKKERKGEKSHECCVRCGAARMGLIYRGHIREKNVHKRDFVLKDRAGRSMALVGQCRSGRSMELKLKSLRGYIGLVQQELVVDQDSEGQNKCCGCMPTINKLILAPHRNEQKRIDLAANILNSGTWGVKLLFGSCEYVKTLLWQVLEFCKGIRRVVSYELYMWVRLNWI